MKYVVTFSTSKTIYAKVIDGCASKDEVFDRVRQLLYSSDNGFIECDDGEFVRFAAVECIRISSMEVPQ